MALFSGQDLLCFRGERIVFSGLEFSVDPGQALVLRGPNGSGKSSLLRLMAGFLRPRRGTIAWGGEAIREDPEAHNRRFHYVGHLDAVKPVLSVTENVGFWATMRDGEPRVEEALTAFAITGLADVPGRFLSAGQKRRVNLARIVASPADLWLLDEPTTALDSDAIALLVQAIAEHRATGGMVIASTHAEIGLGDATTLNVGEYSGEEVAA